MFQFKHKTYKTLSDEELVISYQKKNDAYCLSVLYERYGHLVMGACLKYLKDVEESKDMTMHVFESLFEKLKNHDVSNFKSWLYIVTRNECFMFLRKQNKTITYMEQTSASDELNEDETDLDLKISLVSTKMNELKVNQRQCVDLFYIQNKSYKEISDITGFSINQVKSEIQNGKRNLKILLEKENEFNQ